MVQTCCCVPDNDASILPTGGFLCTPELLTKLDRSKLTATLVPYVGQIPILNGLIASADSAAIQAWLEKIKQDLVDNDVFPGNIGIDVLLWASDNPAPGGGQLGSLYAATAGTSSDTQARSPQLSSGGAYLDTITAASPDQQGLLGQTVPLKAYQVVTTFGFWSALQIKALAAYDPEFTPCPSPEPTPEPCPDDDDDDCYEDEVCFVPKRCAANWSLLV